MLLVHQLLFMMHGAVGSLLMGALAECSFSSRFCGLFVLWFVCVWVHE